jgi:hypothetical protein
MRFSLKVVLLVRSKRRGLQVSRFADAFEVHVASPNLGKFGICGFFVLGMGAFFVDAVGAADVKIEAGHLSLVGFLTTSGANGHGLGPLFP